MLNINTGVRLEHKKQTAFTNFQYNLNKSEYVSTSFLVLN